MSTQVLRPMFVDYFYSFAHWCDCVIVDDSCLSTVGNNSSSCSVSENTILSEIGDVSVTESSDVPILNFGSFGDKIVTWSNFVVSVDNHASIECEKMSSESGTAEGSVSVSKSKISVELENGKAWQPSSEPWDSDLYLYQRAFPGTWGAGMQW